MVIIIFFSFISHPLGVHGLVHGFALRLRCKNQCQRAWRLMLKNEHLRFSGRGGAALQRVNAGGSGTNPSPSSCPRNVESFQLLLAAAEVELPKPPLPGVFHYPSTWGNSQFFRKHLT